MEKNMNILLDLDGVLGDFLSAALNRLNQEFNKNITQEQYVKEFAGFMIPEYYGITNSEFWKIIDNDENFWLNIQPFPWAKQLYKSLKEIGDVTIATSPSVNPTCAAQKLKWLNKHLNITSDNVMIGGKKHLMAKKDTYLIDDYPKNINKFNEAGGNAILVPSNWNTLNLSFEKVWDKMYIK